MSKRLNLTMTDEANDRLEAHPEDNYSRLVSKLVTEYYAGPGRSVERAAIEVRKRELEELEQTRRGAADEIKREREALEERANNLPNPNDEPEQTGPSVREVAKELGAFRRRDITTNNPAIRSKADEYDIDTDELVTVLYEQADERDRQELSSLRNDDPDG